MPCPHQIGDWEIEEGDDDDDSGNQDETEKDTTVGFSKHVSLVIILTRWDAVIFFLVNHEHIDLK